MIENINLLQNQLQAQDLTDLHNAVDTFFDNPELKSKKGNYEALLVKLIKWTKKIGQKDGYSEQDILIAKMVVTSYIFRFYINDIIPNRVESFDISKAIKYNPQNANFLNEQLKIVDSRHRSTVNYIRLATDIIFGFKLSKEFYEYLEKSYKESDIVSSDSNDRLDILEYHYETFRKFKFNSVTPKKKWKLKKFKVAKKLKKFIGKEKNSASLNSNKRAMTVIKTTSRNQVDLINIADKKAGIMITVNSILLSLMIPIFASYIFDMSSYIIPMFILLMTSTITVVLATLATKPLNVDDLQKSDLEDGSRSLFYFDNFKDLSKEEFVTAANDLIVKSSYFNKSIFSDIYDSGRILSAKYKRLRWCYSVFAIGIILTVITFISCVLYFDM